MVFGTLFYKLLSSHMLLARPDGWYSAGATWADLAWHLSMLSSFAERGLSAVREDPIFPGTKLSYPFLPDLLSAWLVRCGFSVQTSLIVPAFLAILGLRDRTLLLCPPDCWAHRRDGRAISAVLQRQHRGLLLSLAR